MVSALLFYIILISAPFLEVAFYDRFRISTITTGLNILDNTGFGIISIVIYITTLFMPLIEILGLLTVLVGLHLSRPPQWIVPLFRHFKFIHTWSMAEIFLLGLLVAYTRLQALVHVHVEIAVIALIGLVLSMVSIDTMLDPEAVWNKMNEKGLTNAKQETETQTSLMGCLHCHQANSSNSLMCIRCEAPLEHRKTNSVQRTLALTLSALFLYIPANIFAILQVTKLQHMKSYTIFKGVEDFIYSGMWPTALLVFTASIAIPLFKLVTLAILLLSTKSKSSIYPTTLTRLYRFIDFIGRWSMIDIFMLSVLVGLVHFGELAQITSGPGSLYFAAVVILTIFAVSSFDPRLIWDVALIDDKRDVDKGPQ